MPTRDWSDVRADIIENDPGVTEEGIAAERTLLDLEVALFELREHRGITQEQLAKLLEVTQPAISKMERGKDWRLSTLAKYIAALGGTIEVRAVFDDETLSLGDWLAKDVKPST